MVLVDSSIWIRAERGSVVIADHVAHEQLATCPPVINEVLRGTRDERHYFKTRAALMLATMLDAPMPLARFEEAAQLYLRCREAAITSSSMDCLIAACAIAHDVPLMHDDADFDQIARIVPLQVYGWKRR